MNLRKEQIWDRLRAFFGLLPILCSASKFINGSHSSIARARRALNKRLVTNTYDMRMVLLQRIDEYGQNGIRIAREAQRVGRLKHFAHRQQVPTLFLAAYSIIHFQ